jgi:hypothetical protein
MSKNAPVTPPPRKPRSVIWPGIDINPFFQVVHDPVASVVAQLRDAFRQLHGQSLERNVTIKLPSQDVGIPKALTIEIAGPASRLVQECAIMLAERFAPELERPLCIRLHAEVPAVPGGQVWALTLSFKDEHTCWFYIQDAVEDVTKMAAAWSPPKAGNA